MKIIKIVETMQCGWPYNIYYYEYPFPCTKCNKIIENDGCECMDRRYGTHDNNKDPICCDCYTKSWDGYIEGKGY